MQWEDPPTGMHPTPNTGFAVSLILRSNATSCSSHDNSSVWPCNQILLARLQWPLS